MRYSVSMVAEGDRVMELAEIVELADAVAADGGVASGIGTASYGAQVVVDAAGPEPAAEAALVRFRDAVRRAGLPDWPVVQVDTLAEDDDGFYDDSFADGASDGGVHEAPA